MLSAKWRRVKKHPKRFNFFKAFKRVDKETHELFQTKKSNAKRRQFSKIHNAPKLRRKKSLKEPEPLIDVLEDKGEIIVIAEFAGFTRDNLKVNVKSQRLTLSAENLDRKYHKSLNLPTEVIPSSIRVSNKNGVLEIRLKKIKEKRAVDKLVGLENAT